MFYDGIRNEANATNNARDGRRLQRTDESQGGYIIAGIIIAAILIGSCIAMQVRAEREVPAASYVGKDGAASVSYAR